MHLCPPCFLGTLAAIVSGPTDPQQPGPALQLPTPAEKNVQGTYERRAGAKEGVEQCGSSGKYEAMAQLAKTGRTQLQHVFVPSRAETLYNHYAA